MDENEAPTPKWKVKPDLGVYWLFQRVGCFWNPIDSFKTESDAWKRAGVAPPTAQ